MVPFPGAASGKQLSPAFNLKARRPWVFPLNLGQKLAGFNRVAEKQEPNPRRFRKAEERIDRERAAIEARIGFSKPFERRSKNRLKKEGEVEADAGKTQGLRHLQLI